MWVLRAENGRTGQAGQAWRARGGGGLFARFAYSPSCAEALHPPPVNAGLTIQTVDHTSPDLT